MDVRLLRLEVGMATTRVSLTGAAVFGPSVERRFEGFGQDIPEAVYAGSTQSEAVKGDQTSY